MAAATKRSRAKKSTGSRRSPTRSRKKSTSKKKRAAQSALTPETRRALGYLGLLGFCGLTGLALASYSPLDPSMFRRSTALEIANWCGRLGAVWADLLYQMVGWGAWWLAPFTAWVALRFTHRAGGRMGWLIAGAAGVWWTCSLLGLLFFEDPEAHFPAGGALGQVTGGFLLEHIGPVGAYIVVALALVAAATVLFSIDWEGLANRGVGAVEGAAPQAAGWFWSVAGVAGGGVTGLAARGIDAGRGALGAIEDRAAARRERWDEDIEEYEDEADPESRWAEPAEGGRGLAIPIHPEPVPVIGSQHTDWGNYNADAPIEDNAEPTVVGSRELVEVRYEPTTSSRSVFDAPEPARLTPPPPGVGPGTSPGAKAPRGTNPRASQPNVSQTGAHQTSADPIDAVELPVESAGRGLAIRERYEEMADRGEQIPLWQAPVTEGFELPDLSLLDEHEREAAELDESELRELASTLEQKLRDFRIEGEVTAIQPGPVITTLEYLPAPGVKLSKIAGLSDDIAMAMRAIRVRIVAPIPGRGVVGIEIPNKKRQIVWYRDLISSREFREGDRTLPMILGKTVEGRPYIADLAKMPHLLVGGTTGSGKSVGVNAMLMSMLYTRPPEELRMILIDPKMLEFELYQDIPHLLHPVVTEPRLASAALKWACTEMDDRYRKLARWGTRNIASYNKKVERELEDWTPEKARRYGPRGLPEGEPQPMPKKMPYIVIVIDELADLMMVAAKDVEESIVRLAQKARACGIHLIVATQRPSVDVITGLIKANMPSRIAYQVRSRTDGRTILDQNGAENLLGKGDMLYLPPGVSALQRLHGPLVADEEVQRVADFLRDQGAPDYSAEIAVEDSGRGTVAEEEFDEFYDVAVQIVTDAGKASTSMIQRHLKIGYNRAARIIEVMEREGVVGPADGARPRKVLVGSV